MLDHPMFKLMFNVVRDGGDVNAVAIAAYSLTLLFIVVAIVEKKER